MSDLDRLKAKHPVSDTVLKLNPHLSKRQIVEYARHVVAETPYDPHETNPERLRPEQPQPIEGGALERRIPRKETSGPRLKIVFTIHARRPCDWDGYHIKPLQDLLVEAGLLPGDAWHQLEGCIRSRKVPAQGQEFTQIEIETVDNPD